MMLLYLALGFSLIHIAILIKWYDLETLVISSHIQILAYITMCYFMYDLCIVWIFSGCFGGMMVIMLHNINTKFIRFNSDQKRKNRFLLHRELRQYLSDHNEICRLFLTYNQFWKTPFFTQFLTMVPLSLILLQTIMFEQVSIEVKYYIAVVTLILVISIFMLQYFYAYLSKQVHKSTKLLAQVQWQVKGWPFRLSTKLKLMAYFERLNANKKIGVTLGPTVTVTFPVFAQVYDLISEMCKGGLDQTPHPIAGENF